jgi:hypothetical protein
MAINLVETEVRARPASANQNKRYRCMGMNLGGMIYLQKLGLLTRDKNVFMDIGPQTVYFTTDPQIREFVANQGQAVSNEVLESEIKRLVYFSTPRPEERTTFFSEISDLTNIDYHSFDVCPGLKTDLLDLNFDRLPPEHANRYDVLINFGTTEHIFNQWNSFEIMHDATKVGGVMYHQLPMSAYLDHGYYCYTPLFFKELAEANGYEIVDQFICIAGESNVRKLGLDVRGLEEKITISNSGSITQHDERIPCFNIHVVLRKTKDAPFRVSLEIATAHSATTDLIMSRYTGTTGTPATRSAEVAALGDMSGLGGDAEARITALVADRERRISELVSDRERRVAQLVAEREEARARFSAIQNSFSWKITAPVRALSRALFKK